MAINHLQNNGNSESNTGHHNGLLSNEVRNAELHQFGPNLIRNDNVINSDASVTKRRYICSNSIIIESNYHIKT